MPARLRTLAVASILAPLVACGAPPAPPSPRPAPSALPPAASASAEGPSAADREARRAADEAKLIAEIAAEYRALLLAHAPESATALGIHDGDGRLSKVDRAGWDAGTAAFATLAARVDRQIPRDDDGRLSLRARIDLEALRGALSAEVLRRELRDPENKPSLYVAPMNAVFLLGARDFAPAADRAAAALARIEATPDYLAAGKVSLRAGKPPAVWVSVGIERAKSAKEFYGSQRAWLVAARPADAARVDAALAKAIAAYEDFRRFLEKDLAPTAKGSFRAGREAFRAIVKADYAVTLTPEEIAEVGRRVFRDTEAEIAKVSLAIDPKLGKDPSKLLAVLKKNHPKEDDLLPAYRAEVARARAFLVAKNVVPMPPGDDLQVVETPVFQRATIQAAYDPPPPFDAVARGFFFVTPVEPTWSAARKEDWLRESDHGDIVDTAVHEAYPGHHLQLSFARLHPSPIRKALDTAIFSEGWALYTEELMAELGYYTKEERLLQLEWALVRAARVILDVELHTGTMTVEEAQAFLEKKVHLEPGLARNEARRYAETPTQPLSYMLGRERLFALRARWLAQPGATLLGFHEAVLHAGSLPPDLLARELLPGH